MSSAKPTVKEIDLGNLARWEAALTPLFKKVGHSGGHRAVELIWEDQRQRWRSGEHIPAEAYLNRAPRDFASDDRLDVVYGEAIIRRELGQPPELSEFKNRFPALAEPLARQWDFDDLMESCFEAFSSVASRNRIRGVAGGSSQSYSADTMIPVSTALESEGGNQQGPEHKTLHLDFSEHPASSSRPVTSHSSTPAMIGRYRVIAPLGGGGQATVYRVVHPTLAKDLVAKISHWPIDPAAVDRDGLVAEGRLLAEINHPNIARVIDLDFHLDRPFVVMEYVRGRNLRQFVSGRRLRPEQAAKIVAQIARGLGPVHALGIIHRDLKPQNIVIDEAGNPRIIDFGLALLRGAWRDDIGEINHVSGTVPYMAPEQARGEHDRISTHSDVFSLGAVLFDLLVGEPPFVGENLRESLYKAQKCDFDRAALTRSGANPALKAICLKAMAADPADRHESAEALAQELEAFLAPPPCRKTTWLITGAAVAVVLLLAAGAASIWGIGSSKPLTETPVANNTRAVPAPSSVAGPLLDVRAWSSRSSKPSRFRDLVDAIPLIKGDELTMRCEIPAGFYATLYGLTSAGTLQMLASVPSSEQDQVLRFPAQESQAAPLSGPAATQLLLVHLSKNQPLSAEKINALADRLRGKWPMISPKTILRATPAGVEAVIESRDFDTAVAREDSDAMIREQLEDLRQQLQGESDYFEALTFAFGGSS